MTTSTDTITLQMIMEKLVLMEESITKLNEENGKRAQEITTLAKHNNLIETEDESLNAQRSNSSFRSPRDGKQKTWSPGFTVLFKGEKFSKGPANRSSTEPLEPDSGRKLMHKRAFRGEPGNSRGTESGKKRTSKVISRQWSLHKPH